MKCSLNKIKIRQEIFKQTLDDWYPNFHGNKAKLIYHGDISWREEQNSCYRVSCWGNDDFGINKDFKSETEFLKC